MLGIWDLYLIVCAFRAVTISICFFRENKTGDIEYGGQEREKDFAPIAQHGALQVEIGQPIARHVMQKRKENPQGTESADPRAFLPGQPLFREALEKSR